MSNTNHSFNGNLSFREARSCLTAGARGGPWSDVEARIRAASAAQRLLLSVALSGRGGSMELVP